MITKTKKALFALLMAVATVFVVMATANAKTSVKADEEPTITLSETKYGVSEDGNYMLLVTAIDGDVSYIYEVGYTAGAGTITGPQTETAKYYTSITMKGGEPQTSVQIFGDETARPMIIWEIDRPATATTYTAYAKVGTKVGEQLYTTDTEVKATARGIEYYTITFDTDEGSTIEDIDVPKYTPSSALSAVTTTKTGYTFSKWQLKTGEDTYVDLPNNAEIESNITLKAVWTANVYTITWKDGDGNTLDTDEVAYGEVPAYTGETPTKTATAQYTYTFDAWTPAVTAVTDDATYTATFTETKRSYTITWKNYDGTTLDTDTVEYGETPEYTGETPEKDADANYEYTFDAWTPAITAVTGEATYTAAYTSAYLNEIKVADHAAEVLIGKTVNALAASIVKKSDESAVAGEVSVAAKFNGTTVDISSGYAATEAGTLALTYTAADVADVTVNIAFVTELKTTIKTTSSDKSYLQGVVNGSVKDPGTATVDGYTNAYTAVYSAANQGETDVSFAIGDYSDYDYIDITVYAVNYVKFKMGTVESSGDNLYENAYVHWKSYTLRVPVDQYGALTATRKWGDMPMLFEVRSIVGVDAGLKKKAYVLNRNLIYQDDRISIGGSFPTDFENEFNTWVTSYTGCTLGAKYNGVGPDNNWITPGIVVTPTATSGSITIKLNALNENISASDYMKATIVIAPCWVHSEETFTIGGVTNTTGTENITVRSFEWDCSAWGDEITVSFTAPDQIPFSIVSITLSND